MFLNLIYSFSFLYVRLFISLSILLLFFLIMILWFALSSPLLKPKTHFLKPKILCGCGSGEGRRGRGLSSIVAAWVSLFVSLFIFLSLSVISRPFLSLSPLFYLFFSLYLPLNQPSMVEMRCGIHGSVAGFHHP